jgi:hypothetical protein
MMLVHPRGGKDREADQQQQEKLANSHLFDSTKLCDNVLSHDQADPCVICPSRLASSACHGSQQGAPSEARGIEQPEIEGQIEAQVSAKINASPHPSGIRPLGIGEAACRPVPRSGAPT